MNNPLATLDAIQKARIVAVIRAPSREILVPLAAALIEGGIFCLEVTMSTPEAILGIGDLEREFGSEICLGVGTVLHPDLCQQAADAGATFVVSPIFDPEIVLATKKAGALSIPGTFTPTEIYRASQEGADVIKVFPATTLGPSYFRDILAPMPMLRLMPTGGVEANNVAAWFQAGAFAVGAGSSLVSKSMVERRAWTELTTHARRFLDSAN